MTLTAMLAAIRRDQFRAHQILKPLRLGAAAKTECGTDFRAAGATSTFGLIGRVVEGLFGKIKIIPLHHQRLVAVIGVHGAAIFPAAGGVAHRLHHPGWRRDFKVLRPGAALLVLEMNRATIKNACVRQKFQLVAGGGEFHCRAVPSIEEHTLERRAEYVIHFHLLALGRFVQMVKARPVAGFEQGPES